MPSPKNTLCRPFIGLLFLVACLLHGLTGRAQTKPDSTHRRIHYRYSDITLFSGAEMQFFGRRPGVLAASFPYTSTDVSGVTTNQVFSGETRDIYGSAKGYVIPLLFEVGHRYHFVHFGLAFVANKGGLTGLPYLTAGYGLIRYVDFRRGASRRFEDKVFAIKASVNLTYTADGPGTSSAVLGSIDNYDKTLYLLGETANPTYTTGGYTTRSGTVPLQTHIVQTLEVSYSQRELSLLPRVSISLNPYHSYARCELMVGYNLPLVDRGGLYLNQKAGGDSKGISGAVNINNSEITASYEYRTIHSAPYRFGGLFVGVLVGFGKFKEIYR